MGVTEDINWLKADESGAGKVFLLIADKGNVKLRELKQLYGSEDWWPVKAHVRALVGRELVTEIDGNYVLTEYGRRVLESYKALEFVPAV
jgi:predicted transcriptional regulator